MYSEGVTGLPPTPRPHPICCSLPVAMVAVTFPKKKNTAASGNLTQLLIHILKGGMSVVFFRASVSLNK